jgi:hypothetical protein
MIRLFIDNTEADVDASSEISISLSMASLTSTSWGRANYSKSITIPATPLNRRLMGDCEQPLAAQMFNHTLHTARVEVDGCIIIEGTIYLTASFVATDGYYRFYIIGNAREWIATARKSIAELLPEARFSFDEEHIRRGLTQQAESGGGALLKFFPVERRGVAADINHHNRLLADNYHPFVNLSQLLRVLFDKAGYAVESEFLDSEFFRGLYMSGRWSEHRFEEWAQRMDFFAVLNENSPEVYADESGRVYADPTANFSTVGNLVDMPDGNHGSFNKGALQQDSTGRILFAPTSPVRVAFEHRLRFFTDYRVASRQRLEGLNRIRPAFGDEVEVPIPNTFRDHRGEPLESGHTYSLIIFDHDPEALYRLYAKVVTNPNADLGNLSLGDYTEKLLYTTSLREGQFSHSHKGRVVAPRLEMVKDGLSYSPTSDWAIYDGSVREYGTTMLDVTLRSKAREYSPANPKYFDMFCFGGSGEPFSMQLLAGSSLRPIFIPHPIEGEELSWGDVMNYSFTGLDLLSALKELFDLQIYTDPLARKVCIEPRSEWCDPRVVVDLTGRIDSSKGVVVEELGADHPQRLTLAYRRGDKAAEELSEIEGREYGLWSEQIDNIFATEGERRVENGLFAASVTTSGTLSGCPSASLIMVGDSEPHAPSSVAYHNFLPKVVHYRGLHPLPFGEQMEYPSGVGGKYPLLTFYDDGELGGTPSSLLFSRRYGVEGLGRYWQPQVDMLNHSRRITLYASLRPEEVEQIVVPTSTKRDFRAHYLVEVDGQRLLCRLEEVVDYNPASPSTRLVMVTI